VVSPILESAEFLPNPSPTACSVCAYAAICEQGNATDGESDS
jgi:hypothetical protein